MLFRERLSVLPMWWVLAGLLGLIGTARRGGLSRPGLGVGTSITTLLIAAAIFVQHRW